MMKHCKTEAMDLLVAAVLLLTTAPASSRCPRECHCDSTRVVCDRGGMTRLPVFEMDYNVQVLEVTPPVHRPNNLTIGRFFGDFVDLREVRIVNSNVPAIGDSTFWPGRNMQRLDLSRNNLTLLHAKDFYGLDALEVLDLADNKINATPSAPFMHLSSLTTLSLARNKLKTLVPRFFYMLPNLQHLDLSGNPFGDINPDNLKDVRQLRTLRLASCRLSSVPPTLYELMPHLEELDLRDNVIFSLSPHEFGLLRKLRILHLDGNQMSTVHDYTFSGHSFVYLGLSRNRLSTLAPCAFCRCNVTSLNLSHNELQDIASDGLSALGSSVQTLNASFSRMSGKGVANLVRGLTSLEVLDLYGSELVSLPEDTFITNPRLVTLNMSHNKLEELRQAVVRPLDDLRILDLSYNEFSGMSPAVLEQLDSKAGTLTGLSLDGNPWMCTRCDILPLVAWANGSTVYSASCQGLDGDGCLRCEYPTSLAGRWLFDLSEEELEPCTVPPVTQPQVLVVTSQIGVIVAAALVLLLVPVILVVVVVYRRQGAVYYTHEEERAKTGMYEHLTAGELNGYGDEKKSVFFTQDEKTPSQHG